MKVMNNSLIGFINSQVKRKYFPLILVVGQRRSGKSMCALNLAYSLNQKGIAKFDIEKNMILDIRQLLKILIEGTKGQIFIIDEAVDKLLSKEFWSEFSLAMEKIISTQGYLENIFVVIIPLGIQLNKSLRRLTDIKIEMIQKRLCKWTIIKKRYGELGFSSRKAIWEFNVPSQLMIPKLDKEIIESYKKIESKEKRNILQDLDDKFSLHDSDDKFLEKLETKLEKDIVSEKNADNELSQKEKQLRLEILNEKLRRLEEKRKQEEEEKERIEKRKQEEEFYKKLRSGEIIIK